MLLVRMLFNNRIMRTVIWTTHAFWVEIQIVRFFFIKKKPIRNWMEAILKAFPCSPVYKVSDPNFDSL